MLFLVLLPAIALPEEESPAVGFGAEQYLGKTHVVFEFEDIIFFLKLFYDPQTSCTDRVDMAWPIFSQIGEHPKGYFGISATPQIYSSEHLRYGDLTHPKSPAEIYVLAQYRSERCSAKLRVPFFADEGKRIHPQLELEELRLGHPKKIRGVTFALIGSCSASRPTGLRGGIGVKITFDRITIRIAPERSSVTFQIELSGLFAN